MARCANPGRSPLRSRTQPGRHLGGLPCLLPQIEGGVDVSGRRLSAPRDSVQRTRSNRRLYRRSARAKRKHALHVKTRPGPWAAREPPVTIDGSGLKAAGNAHQIFTGGDWTCLNSYPSDTGTATLPVSGTLPDDTNRASASWPTATRVSRVSPAFISRSRGRARRSTWRAV